MRAKKSLKNLIFNVFQQIISIITGFLLPPLLVSNYGSSINGLISTVKQIVSYAQLTGAGIASASTYVMYKPLAKKNYKKLSGIFNATKDMFIKAGNIASIVMLMVAFIYPFFVKKDVDVFTTVMLVTMLGACGVSEFYFIGKYQALFSADQKNYLVSIAQGLGNVFNIVISVILIKFDCNIILVEFGAMSVYITRVLFLSIYFKKNYKYIDLKEKSLPNEINQRGDAIIHEITALVINNSSTILISLFIGLKQASVFAVYALVFSGLNTICSVVSNGIYASFGDVVAKNEKKVLSASYNIFECVYTFMIFMIYTVAYIMIMPFIQIYTKNMVDYNYVLPVLGILFVLVGITNNIKIPARTLVLANGNFKETKKYSLIEMIINIVGQLVFMYFFGIYGALIGCLLAAIYRGVNFIWYTNKFILKEKFNRIIKRISVCSLLAIIICVSSDLLLKINVDGYLSWFIYAIIVTVIVTILYTALCYITDKKTFKESVNVAKKILGK